jgi:ParB-like nuclease domain
MIRNADLTAIQGRPVTPRLAPNGHIHPLADLFPMLQGDDLDDLVADIRTNGLIQPIVLDGDGAIVDGRNRALACDQAGVEPRYTPLPAQWRDDIASYVMSANLQRRQLTGGQRAMLAAKIRAVCGKPLSEIAGEAGVSKSRVAYAAVVLARRPDMVDDVISGDTSLDSVYWGIRTQDDADARRGKMPISVAPPPVPPRPVRGRNSFALTDPEPKTAPPDLDVTEEGRWLEDLVAQVIEPLGGLLVAGLEWPDAALTRFPLPKQVAELVAEARPHVLRILDALAPSGDQ